MKIYTQKRLFESTLAFNKKGESKIATNIFEIGKANLSQLTYGVFVKLTPESKQVFMFIGKDRKFGFTLQNENDISNYKFFKKDRKVIIGFTY